VTERAAVSGARFARHGKSKASDQAAVDAMRRRAQQAADRRHRGDRRGRDGRGADVVHRREGRQQERPQGRHSRSIRWMGTTLCARDMAGAIATLRWPTPALCCTRPTATWTRSRSARAYPKGTVDLDAPTEENILNLAKAKGVRPAEITAILLDPAAGTADMIEAVRKVGAAVSLISDGDVAGVIHCAEPKTGIDIYLGIGGAPEGVLCRGGAALHRRPDADRLIIDSERAARPNAGRWASRTRRRNTRSRHGEGRLPVRATGVTTGPMLEA